MQPHRFVKSLARTNEESAWLNEKKPLQEKKISQLSANDVTCSISLDTNNQA